MEGKTQQSAAATAAMSERSARKWQRGELPSDRKRALRRWRSRQDPFEDVWESDVMPLMLTDPDGELSATTILEWLDERHPGRFGRSQLRTLQRRMRDHRALHGPDKEVYFQQEHPSGREAQVDFTHCGELGVTVGGEPFRHLLFQFVLSHSGWRYAEVCFGETFGALVKGLQGAFWELGGAHRQPVGCHTRPQQQQGPDHEPEVRGGPRPLSSGVHQDQPEVISRERRGRAGAPSSRERDRSGAHTQGTPGLRLGG